MSIHCMQRHLAALVVTMAVLVAAAVSWPYSVEAHGGVTEFRKGLAGPYEVAFGTSPRSPSPGSVHVSLRVVDLEQGLAVPDASVAMSGYVLDERGSELDSFGALEADLYEEDPVFWDIDLSVEQVGDWVFTVAVEGDLGEGSVDFDVKVRESNPTTGIITIVVLVAFLSVVALAMRTYLTARRAKRT